MFKKVLVPVDLAEPEFTREALQFALRELRDGAEELHMITVVPGFSNSLVASYFSQKDHNKAVEEVARQFYKEAASMLPADLEPILKVYEGSPAEMINRYIKKNSIDLVIMRAHHRNKIDEFLLGSVSARVAERAGCTVMLLKN